jgi:aspartyl-tRNA(Asn)/glutamyl-tRNA(Gln) amidotransferase subunit A
MVAGTITEIAAALRAKRYSCVELTQALLAHRASQSAAQRIHHREPRPRARRCSADAAVASGQARPLTGIPIAHKDILAIEGMHDVRVRMPPDSRASTRYAH